MRKSAQFACLLVLLVATLGACSAPTTPTSFPTPLRPPTLTPRPSVSPGNDREAITTLIQSEGDLVVKQDISGLMAIWDENGVITDAKNTPNDVADDAVWRGKDAIRNRYVVLVFPGAAKTNIHTDIDVQISGDTAIAQSTTNVGVTIAPQGDRWQLAKRNNVWYLTALTYNLLPK